MHLDEVRLRWTSSEREEERTLGDCLGHHTRSLLFVRLSVYILEAYRDFSRSCDI